jgi:hypothetical protein
MVLREYRPLSWFSGGVVQATFVSIVSTAVTTGGQVLAPLRGNQTVHCAGQDPSSFAAYTSFLAGASSRPPAVSMTYVGLKGLTNEVRVVPCTVHTLLQHSSLRPHCLLWPAFASLGQYS